LTNPVAPVHGGDLFGYSVAISGTRLAIGALPGVGSSVPGTAFVYDLASATPTVPAVTLTNPISSTSFGTSVAISGTRAIVGVPNGTAYVYDIAGTTPNTPVVTLNNPPGTGTANFGRAVAIAGTRAVVGGPAATFVYDVTAATPNNPVLVLNVAGSQVAMSGQG